MLLKILSCVLGCVSLVIGEPILGGLNAEVGKYPYLASLQLWSDGTHFCGASIISCSWMLTGAHCINSNLVQNNVDLIYARVGITKLSEKGLVYNFKSGIVHEKYRSYRKNYDVAVLQTKQKIILSSKVGIINLARLMPVDGVITTLAGWGSTENDMISDTLRVLQQELMNFKECKDMYRKYNPVDPVAEENICMKEPINTGMQGGDSGGPMTYNNAQIGIASFSAGISIGLPGVYASIPVFLSWIEGKTGISKNTYLC